MAGKAGEVFIDVLANLAPFKKEVSTGVPSAVSAGAQKLGSTMRRVGAGMTLGLTAPLVLFGKKSTEAFRESAAVAAQTEAGIKSTGGAANLTADQIANLATQVSNYAAVDDEAVQAGANLLLTFTAVQDSVGKGRDVFTEATKAAADLAARGFGSMESNATLLGKALQDPAKGVARLNRVGVDFSARQTKVIERLAASGKTAKAQGVILDNVFRQVGGSARAFGDSAAGAAAKAQITMGNAMEDIGQAIAPVLAIIGKVLGTLAKWFTDLPGPAKAVVVGLLALIAVLGPLLGLVGSFIGLAGALNIALLPLIGIVAAIVLGIVALIAIGYLVVKHWDTIKAFLIGIWRGIKAAALAVWGAIKTATLTIWNAIKTVLLGYWTVIKTIASAYWTAIKTVIVNPILLVYRTIKRVLGWIGDVWTTAWEGLKDGVVGIWDGIVDAIKAGMNVVLGVLETALNTFLQPMQTLSKAPVIGSAIPDIPEIRIPRLAEGALVRRATLAVVGDNRYGEAVVPLNKAGALGGGRFVGALTLTPESDAYVRGIVVDESRATIQHARTRARMARRRGDVHG